MNPTLTLRKIFKRKNNIDEIDELLEEYSYKKGQISHALLKYNDCYENYIFCKNKGFLIDPNNLAYKIENNSNFDFGGFDDKLFNEYIDILSNNKLLTKKIFDKITSDCKAIHWTNECTNKAIYICKKMDNLSDVDVFSLFVNKMDFMIVGSSYVDTFKEFIAKGANFSNSLLFQNIIKFSKVQALNMFYKIDSNMFDAELGYKALNIMGRNKLDTKLANWLIKKINFFEESKKSQSLPFWGSINEEFLFGFSKTNDLLQKNSKGFQYLHNFIKGSNSQNSWWEILSLFHRLHKEGKTSSLDLKIQDDFGNSFLHLFFVGESNINSQLKSLHVGLWKKIIEMGEGLDLNIINENNNTPLHVLIKGKASYKEEMLLEVVRNHRNEINFSIKDENGFTLLDLLDNYIGSKELVIAEIKKIIWDTSLTPTSNIKNKNLL